MQNKILIVNLGSIYPIRAMNQMRTNNMIRVLCKYFNVDLATTVKSKDELIHSQKAMENYGGKFLCIGSLKPSNNIFKKRFIQTTERLLYYLIGVDAEVFESSLIKNRVINLIKENNYDIVISNYWEGSLFFSDLKGIYKILDPHYAVEENIEILNSNNLPIFKKIFERRKLKRNHKLEKIAIENSDLILPLSVKTFNIFKKNFPYKDLLLIPDGTDVDYFSNYPTQPDEKTILFYGAMGSKQNVHAFFRFYNKILPFIKRLIPDVKILIVGDNPIKEIKALHNGNSIIVTGYVEDVRPWLAKAWFKILPLELGSGFRGRIIEVMSMGIPVVGTHNALDSIGMENGKQGFISDNDDELINFSIKILKDKTLHNYLSKNAKEFTIKNYSLDATFGILKDFLIKKFYNE